MCCVLTKGSRQQSQLWQGSLVVPEEEEGLSPHKRPTDVSSGKGERLSSHGHNRQEEVYRDFPFLGGRQPSLYHIPKIIFHSTDGSEQAVQDPGMRTPAQEN